MRLKQKRHLTLAIFGGIFMKLKKKGSAYVMGTLREWQKLVPKGEGNLMPFIIRRTKRPTYSCNYKQFIQVFVLPI